MRIFLSLLPKYQNYTSVLASIIHLRSDAGFFVNPQRISETTLILSFHKAGKYYFLKYFSSDSYSSLTNRSTVM